jgi:hypothetical protein
MNEVARGREGFRVSLPVAAIMPTPVAVEFEAR